MNSRIFHRSGRRCSALRQQNKRTSLFAVGDDWQAIYRFSGAEMSLTTAFHHYFGEGDRCVLDTTYRFNDRIGDIANRFVQQNPHQLRKPLNSLSKGNKKSITLLPQEQLEALLDKLSGYAKPDERVLLLARYHHLRPAMLDKAKTRWPKLRIDFMTIHASKGQQADFVIVLGLHEGRDGFRRRRASRSWKRDCYRSRRIFRMPKSGAGLRGHHARASAGVADV